MKESILIFLGVTFVMQTIFAIRHSFNGDGVEAGIRFLIAVVALGFCGLLIGK